MPLLSDYEQRTAWKHQPISGFFHTADGLNNKVDFNGSYIPFAGTTVVFRLGKKNSYLIQLIQHILSYHLGESGMLAAPLPASALHMTLHDLVSPERCAAEPANAVQYHAEMADSINRAAEIVNQIQHDHAGKKITMVADRIVNMVSKSLVLMLKPQTEEDYELLLDMYRRFDAVVNLPYAYTPHITLAYYKPGMLDGNLLRQAVEAVQVHPDDMLVMEFDPADLTAQIFRDMKSYADVPKHICFCCDGGLNRSVIASNILNHMAAERRLPVKSTARAAYPNTQGWPVPKQVWDVLEAHGIQPDKKYSSAKYLNDSEVSHFSDFAAITRGAIERIAWLDPSNDRIRSMNTLFLGVHDPEYGEATYEQTFNELESLITEYLDAVALE